VDAVTGAQLADAMAWADANTDSIEVWRIAIDDRVLAVEYSKWLSGTQGQTVGVKVVPLGGGPARDFPVALTSTNDTPLALHDHDLYWSRDATLVVARDEDAAGPERTVATVTDVMAIAFGETWMALGTNRISSGEVLAVPLAGGAPRRVATITF